MRLTFEVLQAEAQPGEVVCEAQKLGYCWRSTEHALKQVVD